MFMLIYITQVVYDSHWMGQNLPF